MAKIMKDGKPSTSLSRQDREWVKAMGGGGGGGDITVEALNVTANGIYTAEEGKAYSPVTVNVPGFLGLSMATITLSYTFPEGAEGFTATGASPYWVHPTDSDETGKLIGEYIPESANEIHIPYTSELSTRLTDMMVAATDPEDGENQFRADFEASTYTGSVEYDSENSCVNVTGNGTISVVLQFMD